MEEYGYESRDDVYGPGHGEFWDRIRAVESELIEDDWKPEKPTNEQLVEHAGLAQWNFYKAIALDPNDALYYLGQASLGEQYYDFLQETCPVPLSPTINTMILNTVKDTYFLAYNL